MDYKLLVLDIDGTVTNSDKKVTEKTRQAIINLQERGISVAIASGRAPRGCLELPKSCSFSTSATTFFLSTEPKSLTFKHRNVSTKNMSRLIFPVVSGKML